MEHGAQNAELCVVEASGAAVTAVTLIFVWQPHSEIAVGIKLEFRTLSVNPALQGRGVGRAVVREAMYHCRSRPDIEAITITSGTFMERAHGLYQSLGFQRIPASDWRRCHPLR